MTAAPDPLAALAISASPGEPYGTVLRQHVGAGLVDHRGEVGLSAIATLAEMVGGSSFYHSQPPGTATVQSRLSLAVPVPVTLGALVTGRGRVVGSVEGHGTTYAELVDETTGAVVCSATGRAVVVSRATGEIPRRDAVATESEMLGASSPVTLDPALTGREILRGLADGTIAPGPIQNVFGMAVTAVGESDVVVTATPSMAMANQMGTMHGGVVIALMAEVCSLGVELSATAGARYRISDITVGFLRSPALDAGDLTITVEQVKTGRRISSVIATMTDSGGRLLSQAAADGVEFARSLAGSSRP
ncbi:MAG: hypothetical protein C0482_08010 [Gordonia sp.]|nr:hypothetical protein [Gordonia sp. (in: high G+C Gram-positive bacteria)]